MNILNIRFNLANEIGLIVSIIGVVLAMIALPILDKRANRSACRAICSISAIIVVALLANRFDINANYINVPEVKGLSTQIAGYALSNAGIVATDIHLVGDNGISVSENNSKVIDQNICGITKLKNRGLAIVLTCVPYDTQIKTPDISENPNPPVIFEKPQTGSTSDDLTLIIDDCQAFFNGFYHEIQETESSYSYIKFDQGISGHFSYSRELTDSEYAKWTHGGKILDQYGNEVNINASFYATMDGIFAVEIPKNMPGGNYIYLLYVFINDEYCEVRIPFTW